MSLNPVTPEHVIQNAKSGDSVTLNDERTGKVVFARPDGADHLTLNMGGRNGTPAIATARNVIKWRGHEVTYGDESSIETFIREVKTSVSYDEDRKADFHRKSKKILRTIAKHLGLTKDEHTIRSNMGGIAVSGEVTLHADWIYIQFFQSCLGPDSGFMWRSCEHQKDYTGGQNRWMKWEELIDMERAVEIFNNVRPSPA